MASNHCHLILLGLLALSLTIEAHTHTHTHTHSHSHSHSHGQGSETLQALGLLSNGSTNSYNQANLEKLCNQTSYASTCLLRAQRSSLVTPDMDNKGMLGVFLLESYLAVSMAETKAAAMKAGEDSGKTKLPSDIIKQLKTCNESFTFAANDLRLATQHGIVEGDGAMAVENLRAALQQVNQCMDHSVSTTTLSETAEVTAQVISIAITFARLFFNVPR